MTNLLEFQDVGLHLSVGGKMREILRGIQFSVGRGEAVALVGESGSGKSMTAKSTLWLLPHGAKISGSLLFEGHDVVQMSRNELRQHRAAGIGMIFQDPRAHINPVRTIGDFMTEALIRNQRVKTSDARKRCADLLRDVGIRDAELRMRQLPGQMSGGMLQRIMIASALIVNPLLLIADEATTALDVTTQAEVVDIVSAQRKERGLALLFITHDLDLAMSICDRVIVMYAGTIIEQATAHDLQYEPLHPYSSALMLARPSLGGRGAKLRTIPGQPIGAWQAGEGCPFAPRCAFATATCEQVRPALRELEGRLVACHRAGELRLEGEEDLARHV